MFSVCQLLAPRPMIAFILPHHGHNCAEATDILGRTSRGHALTRLLRRVLRRVLETAFEKVLRRVLTRCLAMGFRGRKGSEKGS